MTRERMIEELKKLQHIMLIKAKYRQDIQNLLTEVIEVLEEERPKGKWRLRPLNQTWEVYCTNCNNGKGFMWDEDYLTEYKKHPPHAYCGWCGADMRGE